MCVAVSVWKGVQAKQKEKERCTGLRKEGAEAPQNKCCLLFDLEGEPV